MGESWMANVEKLGGARGVLVVDDGDDAQERARDVVRRRRREQVHEEAREERVALVAHAHKGAVLDRVHEQARKRPLAPRRRDRLPHARLVAVPWQAPCSELRDSVRQRQIWVWGGGGHKLLCHGARGEDGADGRAEQRLGARVDVGGRGLLRDEELVGDKALGGRRDGRVAQHGLLGGLVCVCGRQRRDGGVRVRRLCTRLEWWDVVEHATATSIVFALVQLPPQHLKTSLCSCAECQVTRTTS